MKQQYEPSRQQIAALPETSQDMTCKQGLTVLRHSMSAADIDCAQLPSQAGGSGKLSVLSQLLKPLLIC
ncbi:hypothetical protein QWS60_004356 [Escherichia coli]|nr:DUF5339 family protein [Escherichia coli]ELO2500453.1 hypothetical protein [Escherichia coli]